MGPQRCPGPCAKGTLTELASETLRSKWADSEGVKWGLRASEVQHTKCTWWLTKLTLLAAGQAVRVN